MTRDEFTKKCHWGKYRRGVLKLCIDYDKYERDFKILEKARALCLQGAMEDKKRWCHRQYKKLRHDYCVGNGLSFFLMGVVARLSKKDYLGAEQWIITIEMRDLVSKYEEHNMTIEESDALYLLGIGFETRFKPDEDEK